MKEFQTAQAEASSQAEKRESERDRRGGRRSVVAGATAVAVLVFIPVAVDERSVVAGAALVDGAVVVVLVVAGAAKVGCGTHGD